MSKEGNEFKCVQSPAGNSLRLAPDATGAPQRTASYSAQRICKLHMGIPPLYCCVEIFKGETSLNFHLLALGPTNTSEKVYVPRLFSATKSLKLAILTLSQT